PHRCSVRFGGQAPGSPGRVHALTGVNASIHAGKLRRWVRSTRLIADRTPLRAAHHVALDRPQSWQELSFLCPRSRPATGTADGHRLAHVWLFELRSQCRRLAARLCGLAIATCLARHLGEQPLALGAVELVFDLFDDALPAEAGDGEGFALGDPALEG